MVFISPKWPFTASDFRTLANQASNKRTYERFLALALLKEGKTALEVSKLLNRNYQTILNWVTRYNDDGIEALYYKPPPGQNSLLTEEQMLHLKLAVLKSPKESGIESVQWTYREVIHFIKREFQVEIKERTAQKYLHQLGFVRKRPKQKYAKASDQKKRIS